MVSVTRLKIRSLWYAVPFLIATTASRRQVRQARGFVTGRLGTERLLTFWTMTVWSSEEAMRAFRNAGAHHRAMPRLLKWCDEASYVQRNGRTTSDVKPQAGPALTPIT